MKKLIITAAVVCAATLSQAATFTWKTSGNAYFVPAGTVLVNGQTYDAGTTAMKSASGWTFTAALALTYGTITDNIPVETITYSLSKISTDVSSDLFALPTEDGVSKKYSWSIVITGTDANGNTMVSDAITGNKDYTKSTAAQVTTASPTKWTYTAAPEPTSGLLLLLGMAGLALRRKQK